VIAGYAAMKSSMLLTTWSTFSIVNDDAWKAGWSGIQNLLKDTITML
jgi:hypothetical protein